MVLFAMLKASGPLTLITEIAPVPGTVAGAHIVSSFRIYIFCVPFCLYVPPVKAVCGRGDVCGNDQLGVAKLRIKLILTKLQ